MQAGWMGRNQEALWDQSIRDIVWPGAHDAGTGEWQAPLALVPDRLSNEKLVSIWRKLDSCCLMRPAARLLAGRVSRLAKAQTDSLLGQLRSGARYFDLRLYFAEEKLFLTHCSVGESIADALAQIRQFCEENPREVLILHERARVNVTLDQYERYIGVVKEALGALLVPKERSVHATYGELIQSNQRVVYMLSNEGQRDPPVDPVGFPGDPLIWPPRAKDRWPDAQTALKVREVFDRQFAAWSEARSQLTIAQIVMSPSQKQYVWSAVVGRTLREVEAPLLIAIPGMIQEWGLEAATRRGMNILMFDFISLGEGVASAIQLNLI